LSFGFANFASCGTSSVVLGNKGRIAEGILQRFFVLLQVGACSSYESLVHVQHVGNFTVGAALSAVYDELDNSSLVRFAGFLYNMLHRVSRHLGLFD
jgi:hypothetical protein